MHRGVRPRMDDLYLDQETLKRLVGLRREQAVRCFAGICRRWPLEKRQIQRGAGSHKKLDGDSHGKARARCVGGVSRTELQTDLRKFPGKGCWSRAMA